MNRPNRQNERLDRAARAVLKAAKPREEEIERACAAPFLFDSIKARIKAEQAQAQPRKSAFFVWNFQTAAGALAILLVVLAVAFAFVFKPKDAPQIVKETTKPETKAPVEKIENAPPAPEIVETKTPTLKTAVTAQKTDFKTDAPKQATRARKTNEIKTTQSSKKDAKEIFYPLEVAGNWEANGEDLRIVRAELSRAELFALGVNLPVENPSARIKTDLLIGSDGVARAIRFVE